MNEDQKNIETCLAENILAEVANVPQSPQFRSLVEESFDPLQQQALPPAAREDYKDVLMYHQPYTFTSSVKQLKSNLILLFRRLWRFPFGSGAIRSFADMWAHYITRLSGDETYGIPSRLSSLTDLPSAPALLADRKITNGSATNDGIADGMSLARLLNDTTIVTKLVDDNTGWTLTYNPVTKFANITLFKSNAQQIAFSVELTGNMFTGALLRELDMPLLERAENTLQSGYQVCYHGVFAFSELERVNLQKLNYINGCLFRSCTLPSEVELPELVTATRGLLDSVSGIKRISAPKLTTCNGYSYNPNLLANCPDLEYAYVPNLTSLSWYGTTGAGGTLKNMPKLAELHIGKVAFVSNSYNKEFLENCGALIKLVIYGNLNQSIYLNSWSPTLDSSNLQQFLSNFKTYIALRLSDSGSGKTLTLSQAVRNAIHAAESTYGIENIIVTQKGWTISPAPN